MEKEMNDRDRFIGVLNFEKVDRIPIMDFAYWPETIERWHSEGLPTSVNTSSQVEEYLVLDKNLNSIMVDINMGMLPEFEETILDEDANTVTKIDNKGVILKISKKMASIPHYIRFPVETPADFEKIKGRFKPAHADRYPPNWDNKVKYWKKDHTEPRGIGMAGFFDYLRSLMGLENLSLTFYDNPDLILKMLEYHTEFNMAVLSKALNEVEFDCCLIWEDIAYKDRAMVSKECFDKFFLPCYKRIRQFLHEHGIYHLLVDSDGDVSDLIGWWREGGVTGTYPLEVQAGSDPVILRKRYPDFVLIGGINKIALIKGKEAIDRELLRIKPLIDKGGYIPAIDHGVPPDVSFDNYLYYCKKKRKMIYDVS